MVVVLVLGVVLMRSAGCVINDYADQRDGSERPERRARMAGVDGADRGGGARLDSGALGEVGTCLRGVPRGASIR